MNHENAPSKNTLSFSKIGIGCWAFGGGEYWGSQDQQDVEEVVHTAIDSGLNLFDTARMYNDGKAISRESAERNPRESRDLFQGFSREGILPYAYPGM